MIRLLFVLALIPISRWVFSQETPIPLNIPKTVSPQAYEFTKYGDIPVSKYTGVPDISIPLYTIKTDGLEVPIFLSYHSNGIKVNEEASWVGLGWVLQAGGSIVQVVNEYDDFSGKIARGVVNPDNFDIPGGSVNDCLGFSVEHSQENDTGIDPFTLLNIYDSEPDIFKFNFLEYSGEFIFDRYTETFESLDNSNIKITSDYSNSSLSYPQYFHITVPEGHKFFFQLKTKTVINSSYGYTYDSNGNGGGISAPVDLEGEAVSRLYQLVSIYTNHGEEVNFGYIQSQEVINFPSVSKSVTNYEYDESSIHNMGPKSYLFPLSKSTVNFSATSQKNSYLSFIESGNTRIEFQSADDRSDLVNSHKLNTVIVKSRLNNAVISSFNFKYDYFIGHTDGNNIDDYLETHLNVGKSDNEKLQRLKLISLTEIGKPAYNFTYTATQLPSKTSLAYDHWGFYNGKLTSTLLNRSKSDISYIKAALLNSIAYPTGGKTIFEYEMNELSDEKVVISHYEDEQGAIFLYDNNYSNYQNVHGEFVYEPSENYAWLLVPDAGATITISKGLSITGPCSDLWPINEPTFPYTFWEIQTYNAAAKDLVEEFGWGAIPNFVGNSEYKVATVREEINSGESLSQFWGEATQWLAPGVYLFSVGLNNECGAQNSVGEGAFASINLEYVTKKLTSQELAKPTGAGLRVKKISDFASDIQRVKLTQYNYNKATLMSSPEYEFEEPYKYEYVQKYYSNMTGDYLGADLFTILAKATTRSSNSINAPSINASGKYVGYGMVKESVLDSDNLASNGEVVYRFQNEADSKHPSGANFPLREASIKNGSLLFQTYIDVRGDTIKHIEHNYFNKSLPCLIGWKSSWKKRQLYFFIGDSFLFENIHSVGFYPISRQQTFLESTTVMEYDGKRKKENTFTYAYDSYSQISHRNYMNSDGLSYENSYKYPYNFSDPTSTAMVDENNIANVVEEYLSVDDKIVQQINKKYQEFESALPFGKYTFFVTAEVINKNFKTSQYESEIKYQLFDKEKPLQFITKKGIITSLVWGYNRHYIVAKIEGATYSEVIALLNANIINNPSSDEELRIELDKIRSGLPNAMVTSYTYKPLVGMTSETDPNGQVKLFDYNNQNQLKTIVDGDGNLLNYFQYNFFKRD